MSKIKVLREQPTPKRPSARPTHNAIRLLPNGNIHVFHRWTDRQLRLIEEFKKADLKRHQEEVEDEKLK